MDFLKLPIGPRAPEAVNAVIEVPGGQANKYEYDKHLHLFRLDRPLYASVHYPGDYGFIPCTLAEDGDPLDILVLIPEPTFPGCLLEARPVGVLEMLDQGVPDEKVLAVASSSPTHTLVHRHTDLAPHVLREAEHFFAIYKELEGKRTEVRGWGDVELARKFIRECHNRFRRNDSATRPEI
jgi:inorganic pyrophosphatase